ncbi:uncharacterized protein L969DRAFT_16533 [Mixia osmundae IAM 14324]|uniref:Uncharacterized protein n=1 Tax=Mixia osmundae (strain CBS 9802 / IAM 14324 / JCM 22182 / KY 12970) TaxID=764103 RepID=G7E9A9_MIXOS|nr:uncharacterized protein L969DRAFT_16533 [Mixia osmundae IAM 14324]KEI39855.1 hypothetical protein L969DRAFT_16533 [Mixia osmundae IAM 14324]GAA99228.1 hypothetical protein E5Q_05922 [Mixia osmundae IAM 14324]
MVELTAGQRRRSLPDRLKKRGAKLLLASFRVQLRYRGQEVPLRFRPAFALLTAFTLIILSILGFHPTAGSKLPVNDKALHFVCFSVATSCLYWTLEVEESARRVFLWRRANAIWCGTLAFFVGGICSEFVQALLPYKTFQLGDIIANLLGCSVGYFVSSRLEKTYRANRELLELYQPLEELDLDLEDGLGGMNAFDGQNGKPDDPWDAKDELFALGDDDVDNTEAPRG